MAPAMAPRARPAARPGSGSAAAAAPPAADAGLPEASAPDARGFDPLAALADVPHYRESLGARTGGLTLMLWGFVAAGIFLTYGTGAAWLDAQGHAWALSVIWVPWVAFGIAATAALWHSHAISGSRTPTTARDVLGAVAMTGVFFAIAGALYLAIDRAAGAAWTTHSLMAVANGLFAVAVGWVHMRRYPGAYATILTAASVMVAAGLLIGLAGLADTPAALLAALACGASWFGAGLVSYLKG
jgi:hypothetical protein